MPVIEKIYRCRIDFDVDDDYSMSKGSLAKISEKAHKWACDANIELDETHAGPAWNAYFILEGAKESSVMKLAKKIEAYILRFRGGKIYD